MNGMLPLLPDLTPCGYEALRASIRRFGVILPVVKDEHGLTIDGHQRDRASRELGVVNYPTLVLCGLLTLRLLTSCRVALVLDTFWR